MQSGDTTSGSRLDPAQWARVATLARHLTETGRIPALTAQLTTGDDLLPPIGSGSLRGDVGASRPLPEHAIFLTASLSKPLVAMGVLLLVERGELALTDRVCDIIPEFAAAPKRPITVRHLLTHTSGLPDMLPNNLELRRRQAPLSAYVAGACEVSLDFPCGRGVQYQSMGYALLGEVIGRVTGRPVADYLRDELFHPCGMHETWLGLPADRLDDRSGIAERVAWVRVPAEQAAGDDWNWNSRYWRTLGAPWGGVFSTAHDLCLFLRLMLRRGRIGRESLFNPDTIAAAVGNQLELCHDVPEADRRTRGWGLGWRLNWPAHPATFGDTLPPHVCGHWGATGTLWWFDPLRNIGCVLLTTQPLERHNTDHLRLSNAIVASLR
ncbi:MAG: serine hydrolase domain-containing protein [Planctomycetaceae bacterium]